MRAFRMVSLKRRLILVAAAAFVASCAEPTAFQRDGRAPQFRSGTLLPPASPSCIGCVVEHTFVRGTGTPRTETITFAGDPTADYIIDIDDNGTQGANATVTLNGIQVVPLDPVVGRARFHLRQAIQVKANNALVVRLTGKPGSTLVISVRSGADVSGQTGGVVSIPYGGALELPAGALGSNTTITTQRVADPATSIPGVFVPGSTVRLGPSGTVLARPAMLSLPLPPGVSASEVAVAYYNPETKLIELMDRTVGSPGMVSALIEHLSDFLLVFPQFIQLKPGPVYSWALRNCPSNLGGVGGATCGDVLEDVRNAFRYWSSVVNVGFVEAPSPSSADIHIDFATGFVTNVVGAVGLAGWSVLDNAYQVLLADNVTWMPSRQNSPPSSLLTSVNVYRAVLHEIGHYLGLQHPLDKATGLSVMAYGIHSIPLTPQCEELSALSAKGWTFRQGTVKCAQGVFPVTPVHLGSVTAGSTIPAGTMRAQLRTADGSGVAYFPVLLIPRPGMGSLTSRASYTSANGVASLPAWTLGPTLGEQCFAVYALGDDRWGSDYTFDICATVVPVGGNPTVEILSSSYYPDGIVTFGSTVVFTQNVITQNIAEQGLYQIPTSGGVATPLATGLSTPLGLATDGSSIFWVEAGLGAIRRIPAGGGSISTVASGLVQPDGRLVVDGAYVCFISNNANNAPTLRRVAASGGAATDLVSLPAGFSSSSLVFTVSGGVVYFSDLSTGLYNVNRVSGTGGPITKMTASGVGGYTVDLAVSGSTLYLADYYVGVRSLPVSAVGASPTTLVSVAEAGRLAIDGSSLYVYLGDTVRRYLLTDFGNVKSYTSPVPPFYAPIPISGPAVTFDAEHVYWISSTTIAANRYGEVLLKALK